VRNKFYSIVEGQGDVEALPLLLKKIFAEEFIGIHKFKYNFAIPYDAKGKGNLTIEEAGKGIERFLEIARLESDCAGVLVLIDADKEDVKCPPKLAKNLAERSRKLGLPFPVAIVVAVCEYESWLLANIENIDSKYFESPAPISYEGNPEEECSAKGWLKRHMPQDFPYQETTHQAKMSASIDITATFQRCRSFERLVHAIEELLHAVDEGKNIVSPKP
jgi:hypothetical protein